MSKETKVVVPGRLSYVNIWEPKSINGSDTKFGGKIPTNLKTPLRDGDIDRLDDLNYEGCYFINANSKDVPQVVDGRVQTILDRSEVYSGCYGKVICL